MTAPERPEARAPTRHRCLVCGSRYETRPCPTCFPAPSAAPRPEAGEPNPYALDGEALVEAMEIAAGVDAALDGQRIALVHQLRHRVGTRHNCRCEECRAISRVCALAREAIAMKAAKRRRADLAEGR